MKKRNTGVRALTLNGRDYRLQNDVPEPKPEPHEVLIDVQLAGVCETDLQLIQGYMGFAGILGHEFVGIARSGKFAGQRVVGEINCCHCEVCRTNPQNRQHCPKRSVLGILQHDGVFSETVAVPEANLHIVPEEIESERAVFTEPLAAAYRIPEQVDVSPSHKVAVLGDGRLGYLSAQVLQQCGAEVCVVGKHLHKLDRCRKQGISTILLDQIPSAMKSERPFQLVVDCTGSPTGLPLAMELVQPNGTIVMKTTVAADLKLALSPLVIDEVRVIGSRCGPFARALTGLEQNKIEVRSLITSRFPLAEAEQALQAAQEKDQHKVLIEMV